MKSWFFGSSGTRSRTRRSRGSRQRTQRFVVRRRYLAFQGRTLWTRVSRVITGAVVLAISVGGFQAGLKAWETAPFLKVRGVAFDPQVTVVKNEDLPFRTGDHLFGFSERMLRKELLVKYPQLSDLKFSRSLRGVVTVHSLFRAPLGTVALGTIREAVDHDGVFFPAPADLDVPVLDEDVARDPEVLGLLEHLRQMNLRWDKELAQVHQTKAGLVQFRLKDGTEVLWGFIEPDLVELKAKRLERVLFDPSLSHKGFEYAHFVDTDRIVVKKRR